MNKALAWLAGGLGIICIALSIYYWITPAGSLASFMPGYDPGVAAVHFKHGLAALILGIGFMIVAWFSSGPKQA